MACSSRSFLACLLLLAAACRGEEPGVGSGSADSDTGSSSGSGTEGSTSESSDSVEPDSSSGGSTTGDEGFARICDGSDGLRLAMVLGGGGPVPNEIEREIGFYYLYVLGNCQYFALPADSGQTWPDARTGTLDEATEEQLSLALDYGNLANVAGAWGTEAVADGSTLLVSDGVVTMACYAGCEDGPAEAQALWAELGWIDELWASGEDLAGPVRVSVIGWVDSTIDELGAPWPLPIDPWSIAIDGDVDPPPQAGDSVLIDDQAQALTLRDLRQQYREDQLPKDVINSLEAYGHLTFLDEGGQDLFQLWMRDALPIEDGSGLIPLPPAE
jgi:hypothetical protein